MQFRQLLCGAFKKDAENNRLTGDGANVSNWFSLHFYSPAIVSPKWHDIDNDVEDTNDNQTGNRNEYAKWKYLKYGNW